MNLQWQAAESSELFVLHFEQGKKPHESLLTYPIFMQHAGDVTTQATVVVLVVFVEFA
jgi:hypothetical protein